MLYEIRYGIPERYKSVVTSDFEQALRIYDKAKGFATNHNITWVIALWEKDWRLIKSVTVNPTAIIH